MDRSASMFGAGLQAVLEGYDQLRGVLRETCARRSLTVEVTVISYARTVEVHAQGVSPETLPSLDHLVAGGSTYLGDALHKTRQCIAERYADVPVVWVFLLTDGYGAQPWQVEAEALRRTTPPVRWVGLFHLGQGKNTIPHLSHTFDLRDYEGLKTLFGSFP
jgi:uncharacterized protein YegL